MAKRRLSRRQQQRIEAAQSTYREDNDSLLGLVVSHRGGQILAELDSGDCVECKIKSNLGVLRSEGKCRGR